LSDVSAVLPNACSNRIAISGDTPLWPLSSYDSPSRVTPRPFAASVTERPSGSRHSTFRSDFAGVSRMSVIRPRQCRRPIKMSPVCQLEMTLPWGFLGGVWGDGSGNERWRAYAARVAAGFGPTTADG
jgi:hypothetical protein